MRSFRIRKRRSNRDFFVAAVVGIISGFYIYKPIVEELQKKQAEKDSGKTNKNISEESKGSLKD